MNNHSTNLPLIKCPHCGHEYQAAEIFMPEDLLGRPTSNGIIKDALGKILYTEWEEDAAPNLTAKYECDGCGKPFIVDAVISFKTRAEEPELDFSEETVSLI